MNTRLLACLVPLVTGSCVAYDDESTNTTTGVVEREETNSQGINSSEPSTPSFSNESSSLDSTTSSSMSSSLVTSSPNISTSVVDSAKWPSDTSTSGESTESTTKFDCVEIDDGNNSEMSAPHLGVVRVNNSLEATGVIHSPLSPCDEEDYYSFDVTGEVTRVKVDFESSGFGAVKWSLRRASDPVEHVNTFIVGELSSDEVVLPNGRYFIRVTQPSASAEDRARYRLSVSYKEGSSAVEVVNPGDTLTDAESLGNVEQLIYSIPKAQGYVGPFDKSDYYVFTRETASEAFFGLISKFGSPTLTLGYISLVNGKSHFNELKKTSAKMNILTEMRWDFDDWAYYVLIVSNPSGPGSDYKLFVGPKWLKVRD